MTSAIAGPAARSALAGDGLSAGTIQWGSRGEPSSAVAITARDLALFRVVFEANYLSASQLVMLGWGETGERAGQQRLKRLHDAGYLDRFRPIAVRGSAEWNYRLSAHGWAVLAERTADALPAYSPAAITSIAYTEHDLQLAALVVRIALAATDDARRALLDVMPFDWLGPRTGRLDPSPELYEHDPAVRLHVGGSRAGYLEPDATLIARAGTERFAVLIEYDRTRRPHKQLDRLRRYDRWLLSAWRASAYGAHSIPPAVVFVTERESVLPRLVEAADRNLSAWQGTRHAGAREGVYPARQRVVFSSRERINAGDWTMLRVPSLPAALRDEPAACVPRRLVYDLPLLFSGACGDDDARVRRA